MRYRKQCAKTGGVSGPEDLPELTAEDVTQNDALLSESANIILARAVEYEVGTLIFFPLFILFTDGIE